MKMPNSKAIHRVYISSTPGSGGNWRRNYIVIKMFLLARSKHGRLREFHSRLIFIKKCGRCFNFIAHFYAYMCTVGSSKFNYYARALTWTNRSCSLSLSRFFDSLTDVKLISVIDLSKWEIVIHKRIEMIIVGVIFQAIVFALIFVLLFLRNQNNSSRPTHRISLIAVNSSSYYYILFLKKTAEAINSSWFTQCRYIRLSGYVYGPISSLVLHANCSPLNWKAIHIIDMDEYIRQWPNVFFWNRGSDLLLLYFGWE